MIRFSNSIASDQVEFRPAVEVISDDGAVSNSRPSTGVMLAASVQVASFTRLNEEGELVTFTGYNLYLVDDPSGLNGGKGVQADDGFTWKRLNLVAQGEANPQGDQLWQVFTVQSE